MSIKSHLERKILWTTTKWGRITIRVIATLVILYILFLIVNSIVMPIVTRHGNEFSLPNVEGMTVVEAEPILMEADISLQITSEEYHPDKPTGTILSQFPSGGTLVKAGRIVKVVVSLGQKAVEVPELRGFSVRQAKLNLEAEGFVLGDIEWTSTDSLPEKVVVFSFPASGKKIPYGSEVNLMVNQGSYQRTVFVPRLIGLSLDEATMRLEEKGLAVGLITRIVNENYLPETVLEQSEDPGTELLPGEEVDLVVSSTD
ncbi:MAG: PASTA domain-containing protein [candidate division Zixibacteria bacterium]